LRRLADQGGGSAVEFALLFPVLATLLTGIFYVGWEINCGAEVRHAVELGSRIYIQNSSVTLTQLKTSISQYLFSVPISSVAIASTSQTVGTGTVQHITWTYTANTSSIPFVSTLTFAFTGTVDVPAST
jgi:Flp pilus assembly protein TadG